MTQYGWRIGSVAAGSLALFISARADWHVGYLACAAFALPAMITALIVGEPPRHHEIAKRTGIDAAFRAI